MTMKPSQQTRIATIAFFIVGFISGLVALFSQVSQASGIVTTVFSLMSLFFLVGSLLYFFRYQRVFPNSEKAVCRRVSELGNTLTEI
jgi:predicted membrane channel-forming protein YqfA (hemolysin III family)